MKIWAKIGALFLILICHSTSYAQVTGGAPQNVGPSNIVRPPLKPKPKPQPPAKPILPPKPPVELPPVRPSFTRPGIITMRGAEWVGTDHLYGVTNAIGVVVDVVKSDKSAIDVNQNYFGSKIERLFIKEGLNPTYAHPDNTPLPFFNLIIMIVPSGECGFAAYCAGRLFEKVELERVFLEKGVYFQAITWEYQNIVFAPQAQIGTVIDNAVDEIVAEFINRFKVYQTMRVQQSNR